MGALTLAAADELRSQPGRSVLLYLTDRCPVGCAHCSVSALPRGPRPGAGGDPALLERLVDGLCGLERLRLVGISGGEPFGERRALESVTARLAAG
jgi:L-lysine 2,3-aminomutase